LPDFPIAGVEDHVPGIGVDADQPAHLGLDSGLFQVRGYHVAANDAPQVEHGRLRRQRDCPAQ
jgi:hypothetical protein